MNIKVTPLRRYDIVVLTTTTKTLLHPLTPFENRNKAQQLSHDLLYKGVNQASTPTVSVTNIGWAVPQVSIMIIYNSTFSILLQWIRVMIVR